MHISSALQSRIKNLFVKTLTRLRQYLGSEPPPAHDDPILEKVLKKIKKKIFVLIWVVLCFRNINDWFGAFLWHNYCRKCKNRVPVTGIPLKAKHTNGIGSHNYFMKSVNNSNSYSTDNSFERSMEFIEKIKHLR